MRNLTTNPESRELKAVSVVIAMLALPVYASAVAFGGWDARVVSIYVGSVILLIAGGVRLYATHPRLFGSDTTGDHLRTQYHQPTTSHTRPGVAVDVPRAKVWTRSYTAMVTRQAASTLAFLAAYITVTVAVTLGLGQAGGPTLFIAALLILAVFFVIGRSFVINAMDDVATAHDTETDGSEVVPQSTSVTAGHGRAA